MSDLKLNPNPPALVVKADIKTPLVTVSKPDNTVLYKGYVYRIETSPDGTKVLKLTTLNWDAALAAQFNAILAAWLTPEQLKECRRLNGTNEYPIADACPTHNYCDANMAMFDAFRKVLGYEPDSSSDFHTELWNEAWRLSRVNNYKN